MTGPRWTDRTFGAEAGEWPRMPQRRHKMKARLVKSLPALLLSVPAVLAPHAVADAAGGKVAVLNLRGHLVNAVFSDTEPGGCLRTDVFVTANSGTEQDLPSTQTFALAAVSIYKYDSCTNTTLLDATGSNDALAAGDFQVSAQLDKASLVATFTVSDLVSGGSFDVNVNVDWTGVSDIVRNHSNTNQIYPGCHIINRWKGSGRDAVASGVVSDGVTNFTPGTSQYAEIGYVIDGFEIIGCA